LVRAGEVRCKDFLYELRAVLAPAATRRTGKPASPTPPRDPDLMLFLAEDRSAEGVRSAGYLYSEEFFLNKRRV
jgi:hypothetical protein